jgi:hypothetical protein
VNPAWVTALIALITLVGAVGVWAARHALQTMTRVIRFLDDYSGDPGIPGVRPAQPGVMQRLAALEAGMQDVRDQVHLNSGHSMRDTVQRTEEMVAQLQTTVDDLAGKAKQS